MVQIHHGKVKMKLVKMSGHSATSQRERAMHGSSSEWRLQVLNGKFNRSTEKPGNKFTMANDNQRSRGSHRPKGR